MRRGLLAIGAAAVLCGAASLLLQGAVSRGMPVGQLVVVTASATLLLAAAAAAFAYRAFSRANAVTADLQRLTRSMDAAIRDLSAQNYRDTATLGELNAFVSRELDGLAARLSPEEDNLLATKAAPESQGANVVPHPAARRGRPTQAGNASLDGAGMGAALQRAIAAGQAELSLQPIISVAHGSAGGFEVHLHIAPDEGQPVDLRRMQRALPGVDAAALERLAVVSAAEAARRRLGNVSELMPLHVAISEALLLSGPEFAAVLGLFRQYPALAKSVVLSLPAESAESGQHAAALDLVAALGVRLAMEGWSGSQDGLGKMKRAGAAFVKLSADRLLDRTKSRKAASAGTLLEMATAAGIAVVATDVRSDEDAVGLIDLGIDLMTGERFSGPRRLKPEGGNHTGRLARN